MLFNINTLKWDDEILKELDIPRSMLPEVRPSSCIYGETDLPFSAALFPLPELQAISRLHCSARPALRREKQRIHTAPAVFF